MRRFLTIVIAFIVSCSLGLGASQKGGKTTGGSKPVHVKGYTKKDGTYVAPHDRKAPERRSGDGSASSEPHRVAATSVATAKEPAVKRASISPSAATVARNEKGRIQRSEAARHAFARQTGFPNGRPGYVIDHIVPLACGGKDEPSNMQWQTAAEGKAKDKIERRGC
jgi:hypothetical protein